MSNYLDEKFCKAQISRLSGLPGGEKLTREGMQEMICALQYAKTEEEAIKCVTEFSQFGEFFPTPKEIRMCLHADRDEPKEEDTAQGRCERCGGLGFVIRQSHHRGAQVTGALPCVCRNSAGAK